MTLLHAVADLVEYCSTVLAVVAGAACLTSAGSTVDDVTVGW